MGRLVKLFDYTLNTGAGGQTLIATMDPLDYSKFWALQLRASLSTTDTDAGDNVAIYLQVSGDPITPVWDSRIALETFTGDMSASSATPETKVGVCWNSDLLAGIEHEYEETGSLGATELGAGAVKNGPFYPSPLSGSVHLPSCRLRIVVTDGGTQNASFIGGLSVWGMTKE